VRTAGKVASTFSDLFSEADLYIAQADTLLAGNQFTSKKLDLSEIEKTTVLQ